MDQTRGDTDGQTAPPSPQGGDGILVADSGMLLDGDLRAEAGDLVIVGPDGARTEISGYFDAAQPADLIGPDGVRLAGWLVAETALPGEAAGAAAADVLVAQAGALRIGVVQVATGPVFVTHADGTREELDSGDPVYAGDEVATGPDGAVGIVFIDDTTFSLAGNGRIVLDEMVYDPAVENGAATFSIIQGAFTFVSGQIAKIDPDGMVLKTPSATIGIRGTAGAGDVDGGGATRATLLEERGQPLGEMVFNNDGGARVLNVLGALVTVATFATPPLVVPITVQAVGQQFGRAILFLPNAERHLPATFRDTVRQIQESRDDGVLDTGDPNTGQPDTGQDNSGQNDTGDTGNGANPPSGDGDAGGPAAPQGRAVAAIGSDAVKTTPADFLGAEGAGKTSLLTEVIRVTRIETLEKILDPANEFRSTTKVGELVDPKDPFANLKAHFGIGDSDVLEETEDLKDLIEGANDKAKEVLETVADRKNALVEESLKTKELEDETSNDDSLNPGLTRGITVSGSGGDDNLKGTSGTDIINGGGGDDTILGGGGSDLLNGAAGDDTLDGGDDADVIKGGPGNDTLIGGSGSDTLYGGNDPDTFRIESPLHGPDYLVDFEPGTDTLELLKSAFNNPSLFTTSTYPSGNAGSPSGDPSVILYDGTGSVASQVVFYDQDGTDTGYSVVPLAVLPNGTTMALSDISLV